MICHSPCFTPILLPGTIQGLSLPTSVPYLGFPLLLLNWLGFRWFQGNTKRAFNPPRPLGHFLVCSRSSRNVYWAEPDERISHEMWMAFGHLNLDCHPLGLGRARPHSSLGFLHYHQCLATEDTQLFEVPLTFLWICVSPRVCLPLRRTLNEKE